MNFDQDDVFERVPHEKAASPATVAQEGWTDFDNLLAEVKATPEGRALLAAGHEWVRKTFALTTAQPAPQEAQPVEAELARDAARYRYLRKNYDMSLVRMIYGHNNVTLQEAEELLDLTTRQSPQPARAGVGELSDEDLQQLFAENGRHSQEGDEGGWMKVTAEDCVRIGRAIDAAMSATAGGKGE